MPARAIWKGAISFGMVVIPVKLYIATESKDINFSMLHKECNTRLRQKRFCPTHEVEVGADDMVRAYQYAKDQYVVVEEADFESLPVASLHTIEITRFVKLADIDPVYFEKAYVLEPDGVGTKPYYLLKRVLEKAGQVAVAKISLRQKEHLCCLRPYNHAIALDTMYYADEVRSVEELNLPEDTVKVTDQELAMASMLVEQLSGRFEPQEYHDDYRAALERMIEAKLGTAQPVVAAPAAPRGQVRDLMEALKASIEAAKRERLASPGKDGEAAGADQRARKAV